MNFTKNTKLIALIVLAFGLATFAGACQSASNMNTAGTANANHSMNMNEAHNANSMSNMANMSNMSMSNSNGNMSGMSSDMMKSSANAASQPYDLQFLDTMSSHHQSAVDMARMAVTKAEQPELKAFAQKIITDQTREIAQMKDWREKWFAGKPAAMNMEMPGMMDSMKGMDMSKMENSTGNDFDLMFIGMMTPHHSGAVSMAKDALGKAEHAELKTLAKQVIKAQDAEIKQMADWKAKWSK